MPHSFPNTSIYTWFKLTIIDLLHHCIHQIFEKRLTCLSILFLLGSTFSHAFFEFSSKGPPFFYYCLIIFGFICSWLDAFLLLLLHLWLYLQLARCFGSGRSFSIYQSFNFVYMWGTPSICMILGLLLDFH